jgi:DNA-binding GntR family transcriptional regulator
MREQGGPRSLSRAVFADVRADILAGTYPPGARLSPKTIAAKADVSLSVVREALTRLAEQGLVDAEPQLGFSVVTLDLDDVRDISKLRVLIEGAAFRDAIEHADIEYETRVLASHHRLARTPQWKDEDRQSITEEWSRAHAQFHSALLSASPSPRLRDLAEGLRETAELYRRWSGTLSAPSAHGSAPDQPPRDIPAEHQALMQAALDRDADLAVKLIGEHINKTTELLAHYVEDHQGEASEDAAAREPA